MADAEKSGSIWILENGPLSTMLENDLYGSIRSEYPGINIIPTSILPGILGVNTMVATDEDIQGAFNRFYQQKPLGGSTVAVVHINSETSLNTVKQIFKQGVRVTARLPSPDVAPQIDMDATKDTLDKMGVPHIDSNELGYREWVAQSILNILST